MITAAEKQNINATIATLEREGAEHIARMLRTFMRDKE